MPIAAINFTKIKGERKKSVKGEISIKNNVIITNVEKHVIGKQNTIKFTFDFTSVFDPDIGSIMITGEVISIEDEKKADEIIAQWKKDKQLPKDIMAGILNNILLKCHVKALIISQDINLPPPLNLPKVKVK
ncbi:MAG: hypothetical protein KAU20_07355 [Nanoarchaeota archaeon]|nr:hypothetical protein [Nanoarchaeota archaeon]